MVAEQQHDAERGAEAVPRRPLLQLQQPIVLAERRGPLRPARPGLPQRCPGVWGRGGAGRSLDSCEGALLRKGPEGAGLRVRSPGGWASCSQACNQEREAVPLLLGAEDTCHSQGKGEGVPYLPHSPFPIPPDSHLLSPQGGRQGPEQPQVWWGTRNDKEADNPNHRLGTQTGP